MTIATVKTACACSGTDCTWISHARLGQCCENSYDGSTMPGAWVMLDDVGPCCASCVTIAKLRAAGPLQPIRWSKHRTGYLLEASEAPTQL